MTYSIPISALRIALTGIFFALCFGVVVMKLWYLQIHGSEENREKISKQSIRKIRLPAVRGRIFTSDMHIIADSAPSFKILFHPAEMLQPGRQKKTVAYIYSSALQLANVLKSPCPLTEKDIIRHLNTKPSLPITVFDSLSAEQVAAASEMVPPVQGMEITAVTRRFYPDKSLAAHILGYTGREDGSSAKDKDDYSLYVPDMVGKSGVEKAYDETIAENVPGIRGSPGTSLVRVNHRGFIHEILDTNPAQPGSDIVLTLNYRAQKIAEKLIAPRRMAFVLLDAESGAVIAMASSPSADLNLFIPKITTANWRKLNSDPAKPLLNKATDGEYTPGSIFKPLIALALLENGIRPNDEVNCPGYLRIGNVDVKCWAWQRGGHGNLNILGGIQQSCNVYFMTQGKKIGLDAISTLLQSAGIGRETGFVLSERKGILPSREYKLKVTKEKWTDFDTAILSIGQGMICVTPLQAAVYTAAIANGGTLWKPYILKEVLNLEGKPIYSSTPVETGHLNAKPSSIQMVQKGMWMVVNAALGSGKTAKNKKIILSGKTGTAEVGPKNARYKNTWFLAFGRSKDKLYALVIFADHGESGGGTCAPIARDFFNEWLGDSENLNTDEEPVTATPPADADGDSED